MLEFKYIFFRFSADRVISAVGTPRRVPRGGVRLLSRGKDTPAAAAKAQAYLSGGRAVLAHIRLLRVLLRGGLRSGTGAGVHVFRLAAGLCAVHSHPRQPYHGHYKEYRNRSLQSITQSIFRLN